jgi:FtsZ-interacting cell division protein ZipA
MRLLLSMIGVFGLVALMSPCAEAKKAGSQVEDDPPPPATEMNACGCYKDKDDKCHCNKVSKAKLKCQCENDCEPPECVAKRQHDEEKAAELALKKIKERDKQAQVEAKKAQAQKDKEKAAEKAKKDKDAAKEGVDPRWKE